MSQLRGIDLVFEPNQPVGTSIGFGFLIPEWSSTRVLYQMPYGGKGYRTEVRHMQEPHDFVRSNNMHRDRRTGPRWAQGKQTLRGAMT